MQQAAKKHLSPAEYLALEDAAEYKSEYCQGEVFAMAGASLNHIRIVRNLSNALSDLPQSQNCEAFASDAKVWIDSAQLFTYPDLVVICGAPQLYEGREDIVTNPLVLVEVLSDSTKDYDRGGKFKLYGSISSLHEYILIDQYSVHVEQYHLEAKFKWTRTEYLRKDEVLQFSSLDFQLPLHELYDRVKFAQEKNI